MQEQKRNRRQIIGAMAAASAAGMMGTAAAEAAPEIPVAKPPHVGHSQAPQITDVKGKVAYITGGVSGIGLGIARVFYDAGMKVVLGYLNEEHVGHALTLFPRNDPRVFAIQHDVMDRPAWERTADAIEKRFGGVQILVNNAGVGLISPASTGTYKDWEWGLGVNLWGPINGVHTFVPRMLASKQGAQIVTTTSTSGIVPGGFGAGIYTVSKIAAVGLMEELRIELGHTNIGTSAFIPGLTKTNIRESETYRPASLKNSGPPARAPGEHRPPPGKPPRHFKFHAFMEGSPAAHRPMDPVVAGRFVLNGILNNDLFIVAEPEYRAGVKARCDAILDSMIPFKPLPASLYNPGVYRTPIYLEEIAHRKATQHRIIPGT